jgi:predicted phosphodiesterase
MPIKKRKPRTRPVFKVSAIDDQENFKPLPPASGNYPFHLNIENVTPIVDQHKLVFHMAGDTGSLRSSDFQRIVANEMTLQYHNAVTAADRPQFLFHLGDVVYNFGQASEYYNQFFSPYKDYPCPVFAIAGNHDADVDPLDPQKPQTLEAFRSVFCNTEIKHIALAGDTNRKANIQPNVYWALQTPVADIIGLYSNVPKFGTVTDEQKDWFINELKTYASRTDKMALIVCIHHAPYSADTNHGTSLHMQRLLNEAFTAANVLPDIVFSGHVHNYQRFNKYYPNGKVVPFIVAGAGGYSDLHELAGPNDPQFPDESPLLDNVELQNYCDEAHGFLKITISKKDKGLILNGGYYIIPPVDSLGAGAELYDSFTVNID